MRLVFLFLTPDFGQHTPGKKIRSSLFPGNSFGWIRISNHVLTVFFAQGVSSPTSGSAPNKKDPHAPPKTPLEKFLTNAGPLREDGSDKFFGMENVSKESVPYSG